MPRYKYDRLLVTGLDRRLFAPLDLRGAVEYLKTNPLGDHVGIQVEILLRAGDFQVNASSFLKLEQILGKRPAQVWDILDQEIDRQIAYFKSRSGNFKP